MDKLLNWLWKDNTMKAWQKGIHIERLSDIEEKYQQHNKFAFSPFVQMTKPKIADAIDKKTLHESSKVYFVKNVSKVKTPIKCFDKEIALKIPGDISITNISYDGTEGLKQFANAINQIETRCFVYIFEEDSELKRTLLCNGFHKLFSQFKSTAEIIGVYTNLEDNIAWSNVPEYDKVGLVTIHSPGKYDKETNDIFNLIKDLDFANHYSNYNKGKTWSALSIRGYSDDITFIEKPAEVINSKKWADKYKDKEFKIQNTKLYDLIKEPVEKILNENFSGCEFDRIRLMALNPGGGELLRHSDLQDPDVGTDDGKTMRFHVPIITNPNVEFSVWNWEGTKETYNFKKGCMFYLDQRKPHTVVNNGDTRRIHLVIDVKANDKTRSLV